MFEFITRLFKKDPGSKIRKIRDRKYKESVQLQRDGNLREYAKVMKELMYEVYPKTTKIWSDLYWS